MKNFGICTAASLLAASASVANAAGIAGLARSNVEAAELLFAGPVDEVLPKEHSAIVLGQRIALLPSEQLSVGETAELYGKVDSQEGITISSVVSRGAYVAGATKVLVTGYVEKTQSSTGRAQVAGLAIDLTPAMSGSFWSPTVGSAVQIRGTQPNAHGVLLAESLGSATELAGAQRFGISGSGGASKEASAAVAVPSASAVAAAPAKGSAAVAVRSASAAVVVRSGSAVAAVPARASAAVAVLRHQRQRWCVGISGSGGARRASAAVAVQRHQRQWWCVRH